jgi:hypothetical protein
MLPMKKLLFLTLLFLACSKEKEIVTPFALISGTYKVTKKTNTWSMTSGSTTYINYTKHFDLSLASDSTVNFDGFTYKLYDTDNNDSSFYFKNSTAGMFKNEINFFPYSKEVRAFRQASPGKAFGSSEYFQGFKIK